MKKPENEMGQKNGKNNIGYIDYGTLNVWIQFPKNLLLKRDVKLA